ncbi:MAG: hypothetical protein OXT65_05050 [Alphaproteobacteria bacterium]|nr:hypothetical protein [Alphaproteobacteria bacterium]
MAKETNKEATEITLTGAFGKVRLKADSISLEQRENGSFTLKAEGKAQKKPGRRRTASTSGT